MDVGDGSGVHRPRNVDWKRAAALLYGDWGTSKAYVIGLAFAAPLGVGIWGYKCLPIIFAVCALTALVAYNYLIVCRAFPDGGGVYSAAREQSRFFAVLGALLLVANFTVTAALSGWSAMSYFGVAKANLAYATMGLMVFVGALNFFGPKHMGSLAVVLAVPMVVVVVVLVLMSAPFLLDGFKQTEPLGGTPSIDVWIAFCGAILALSGVEAIANLTGVMKLDPGSTPDKPKVNRTALKAILPVGIEVVVGTTLLGLALLALPKNPEMIEEIKANYENILSLMAKEYTQLHLGIPFLAKWAGIIVGIIVGLLLVSAVNTAIAALIGLFYMLARDEEMPQSFTRLNGFGVPWWPMALAIALPIGVLGLTLFGEAEHGLVMLAGLYAIGVVGAIAVNLGSCTFNRNLPMHWAERGIMGLTFVVLFAVELTIAKTKPDALYFTLIIVSLGFALRAWSQRRAGLRTVTVDESVAAALVEHDLRPFNMNLEEGKALLVAATDVTPVLEYAMEEARLRKATLFVLHIKELKVTMPGALARPERARWEEDPRAVKIMTTMIEQGKKNEVPVLPLYAISENAAGTILDVAATYGIDTLILGSPARGNLINLLRGNAVNEVARNLPEGIRLVIYSS